MSREQMKEIHGLKSRAQSLAGILDTLDNMPEQCHHAILKHCLFISLDLSDDICLLVDPDGVLRHKLMEEQQCLTR
jgi:hypothetical protein